MRVEDWKHIFIHLGEGNSTNLLLIYFILGNHLCLKRKIFYPRSLWTVKIYHWEVSYQNDRIVMQRGVVDFTKGKGGKS